MPPEKCERTARREYSDPKWTFVCAVPSVGITAGIDGVFSARFIWKRRFRQQYECCRGAKKRYIWVDGNYDYLLSSINTVDRDKTFVWKSPLPAGAEGPTPEQKKDIKATTGLDIAGWWENPAEPGGYKGGDQPSDEDLRFPPRPKYTNPPVAECGEYALLPDGSKKEWDQLSENPDAPPPDEPGSGSWYGADDEPGWSSEYDSCCKGLTPAQRAPIIRVRHAYILPPDANNYYVTVEFTVTHPCGVDNEPTVEEYVIVPNAASIHVPKTPSRFKTEKIGSPSHWVIRWDKQQVARPTGSGKIGILVKVLATSNCGVTVLETFEISV